MSIPEQPFGFVAGRWVLSLADTPMDSDRAPDYKPLYPGSVIFNNKLSHRVVGDGAGGTIGIVKTRYEAQLNEEGKLIDAEEHEFVALPVGVYSVTFSFGQYSWPNFDIEVKAEHTIDSPLWLPSKSPIPAGPGIVHVVSEEARLAAEAAAASAWEAVDTPGRQGPQGDRGPMGSIDGLAGAFRLNNYVLKTDNWLVHAQATVVSDNLGHAVFIVSESGAYIRTRLNTKISSEYYVTALVKSTSNMVRLRTGTRHDYHTGSGEFERLSIRNYATSNLYNIIQDDRTSGWDEVEVKDFVGINLTEVFGAGNEPSKEYMDTLVENHGGYIDGEQYVVGDALNSQVVQGPGMSLRHDNSVGTRVLLDHPGGTVMLHGDTGWRTLTSWDETGTVTGAPLHSGFSTVAGVSGQIAIRRSGTDVMVAIVGATLTGHAEVPLPGNGFGSGPLLWQGVTQANASGQVRWLVNRNSVAFRPVGAAAVTFDSNYAILARYPTPDAWPTSI